MHAFDSEPQSRSSQINIVQKWMKSRRERINGQKRLKLKLPVRIFQWNRELKPPRSGGTDNFLSVTVTNRCKQSRTSTATWHGRPNGKQARPNNAVILSQRSLHEVIPTETFSHKKGNWMPLRENGTTKSTVSASLSLEWWKRYE